MPPFSIDSMHSPHSGGLSHEGLQDVHCIEAHPPSDGIETTLGSARESRR